jgi:outer membrane protein assembly factor BamD (BamD/ComL family)
MSAGLWAQQPKPQAQEPAEEDETLAPKTYTFNPLQANKELTIGDYYFKKKNYRAAAKRYTEATHWNPNYAQAYLRLGEAEEKLHDKDLWKQAYSKYVELAPDAKNADSIKKKLSEK